MPHLTEEMEDPCPRVGLATHAPPLKRHSQLHQDSQWPRKYENLHTWNSLHIFIKNKNISRALRKGLACGHSAQLDALWLPQDTIDVEELIVDSKKPEDNSMKRKV